MNRLSTDSEGILRRNTRLGGEGTETTQTYRIREQLSVSELAVVYAARHEGKGVKCVVKEFFPKALVRRGKNGRTVHRLSGTVYDTYLALWNAFINEGNILREVEHPGIVRWIDQFEQNGTVYMVMEYCPGMTLDRYVNQQSDDIEPGFLYKTMLPLIEAVEYIHGKGIIHRDLNPGNILIDERGRTKLLDFGSAVRYEESEHPILTTAGYSALELYSEKSRQGPASDVYSMSALLHYCCKGTPPLDVRQRLFDERLEPFSSGLQRSWPFLSRAVRRGLAVAADKRPATMKWLKHAIRLEYFSSLSSLRHRRSG